MCVQNMQVGRCIQKSRSRWHTRAYHNPRSRKSLLLSGQENKREQRWHFGFTILQERQCAVYHIGPAILLRL